MLGVGCWVIKNSRESKRQKTRDKRRKIKDDGFAKVVTPVDLGSSPGGVQIICNYLKRLDSGFRRNDG